MKKKLIKGVLLCAFATGIITAGNLNPVKANAATLEGYVTASALNVRSSDSIHSHKIGLFERNTKVKILSVGKEWDKVQYGNRTGYVYNEYIKTIEEESNLNVKGHVINISSYLRVRSSDSTNSHTKGYLRNGQSIDIISKVGSWYKIKYNGGTGYVYGEYVSVSHSNNSESSHNISHNTKVEKIQKGHIVNISSCLRVRSSDSTNSHIKGYLRNGQSIDIISKVGSWYKIKYNGGTGYVYGEYVSVNNSSNDKPTSNKSSKRVQQTGLAGEIARTKVAQKTNQIILVVNNKLTFWNKDKNGKWDENLSTGARIGYGGLKSASNKHEGDGATPTGAYPILYGFGFGSNPGTSLKYKRITNNSYFVDDVHSSYYNQWYEGKGQRGEHMIDHPQYKYGMVIGYNTSCRKGKGSAIFLHCNGRGSTAGCVSVPESTMLKLLKSTHKGAYIIITSSENNLKYY